jgi:hypothetical protein
VDVCTFHFSNRQVTLKELSSVDPDALARAKCSPLTDPTPVQVARYFEPGCYAFRFIAQNAFILEACAFFFVRATRRITRLRVLHRTIEFTSMPLKQLICGVDEAAFSGPLFLGRLPSFESLPAKVPASPPPPG